MRWAMAYPWSAPGWSTRRINMPKVPGSISFLAIDFQGLDYLCLETVVKGIGEQGTRENFFGARAPDRSALPVYSIVTLSTTPAAAPQRPTLPAPLWHTGLLLLYVLVPLSWWPGWSILARAIPYNRGAWDIYVICKYAAAVGFVCFGLSRHDTPLEDLLGKTWTRWQDALRDVAIGLGFWMVARYTSRLIYFLSDSHGAASILVPHHEAGIPDLR